jgi:hypothetical protein
LGVPWLLLLLLLPALLGRVIDEHPDDAVDLCGQRSGHGNQEKNWECVSNYLFHSFSN